jgi:hypothetical protein
MLSCPIFFWDMVYFDSPQGREGKKEGGGGTSRSTGPRNANFPDVLFREEIVECGEIAPNMEKVARAIKKKIDGIRVSNCGTGERRNARGKRGALEEKQEPSTEDQGSLPRLASARMREPTTWQVTFTIRRSLLFFDGLT